MTTVFFASVSKLSVLALLALCCLNACGRPATEAECREILRRSARLELQDRLSNPSLIEAELDGIEESMQGPMMKKCVGKPITDRKMDCIRNAKTTKELFGRCF